MANPRYVIPIMLPIIAADVRGEVASKNTALSVPDRHSLSIMAKPAANSAIQQTTKARAIIDGVGAVTVVLLIMGLSLLFSF
ncbi:hypothetical protein D9M69_605300 [compost metagenome]